jgi:protein O-mannosyl-transferase
MRPGHPKSLNAWLIPAGLAVVTLAVYLPVLGHSFVDYDDQQYVTNNPRVQAGLTVKGLIWAFGFYAGNWHPLTWLSHMLDCQFYGANAGGHHLTNVLLHVASTQLLFAVLNRMTRAPWRSAAVAALFAWHPLHVESVAWVAERKDVLCGFFWMLTLWLYVRYVESPLPRRYLLTLGSFVLCLMAKPMGVTLPFVLLLLDYWPLKRIPDFRFRIPDIKRPLLEKIPFLVLSAAVCVLTLQAQQVAIVSTAGLPVSQRLASVLVAYQHYVVAMFVPRHLAVYYPYQFHFALSTLLCAGIGLGLVTWVAIINVRRRPYLVVGWLWYLGTLVPVIGLVQVGDQAWADRYTYLPLIGLFVAVVWLTSELIRSRLALQVLSVLVLLALIASTSVQLSYWRNTRTLFEHTAQVTHQNALAVTILGSLLAMEGKPAEAMEQYRTALRYQPRFPEAHFYLGNAYDAEGRLDEALAEYQQALWFKPTQAQTHIFMGIALGKQKKYDEAMAHYAAALKINPDSAVAENNLARVLHTLGRLDEAVQHYQAALEIDPKLQLAHNNLGVLLLQQGRIAEGTEQLREALRLKPDNTETGYNLALALNKQGQWEEAAQLFEKSAVLHRDDPQAHYEFARALAHLRRTREAMGEYAAALLINPNHAPALDGLAWILSTDPNPEFRNGTEAVKMAGQACSLTTRTNAAMLKTLAAAYAETGRFDDAINTLEAAMKLSHEGHGEAPRENEEMLKAFQQARPWRDQ